MTALEAKLGDAAYPPESPPAAGLPSDHHELRAAAARERGTPSPQPPFPAAPAGRPASSERQARIREERLAMGMGASSFGGGAPEVSPPPAHPRSERMRVLPPTGFM